MNAESIYVDPSALRSLYIHDDRSARFCSFRRRVLDLLHVATAVTLGTRTFVSYDSRQRVLAKAVGLRLVTP